MGSMSLVHWVVVALVILVFFGRGKISETMGDFGKGIKSFRKGLNEEDGRPQQASPPAPPPRIAAPPPSDTTAPTADTAAATTDSAPKSD